MRVVYLNPSGQMGGAELALVDLMANIRAAGPKWSLYLIASADGALALREGAIELRASIFSLLHSREYLSMEVY